MEVPASSPKTGGGSQSLDLKGCMVIPDSFEGHPKDLFCIPRHYEDSIDRVLIPYGLIQDRIEKVAFDIFADAKAQGAQGITAVCMLKGGFRFFNDLLNKMNSLNAGSPDGSCVGISVDFARLKSYVNDESRELSVIGKDSLDNVRGKHVLLVEDIIDTGKTIQTATQMLLEHQPLSVKVATMMRKRTPLSNGFVPDYAVFEVPNTFVIGYSGDYNEYFRDLAHICTISQRGIEKYRVD